MKINEYKLDSWIYLSSGWEVLEDSHTTYNTTVCSGVSPSNTHSAYVHLCVLIFFLPQKSKLIKFSKEISAGIFLKNGVELETATHPALSEKQIYRPDAFQWGCCFYSLSYSPVFLPSSSNLSLKPMLILPKFTLLSDSGDLTLVT